MRAKDVYWPLVRWRQLKKEHAELKEEAKRYRVALARIYSTGIDWCAYPRKFETMERCLEQNSQTIRDVLGDRLKDALQEEIQEFFKECDKANP